MTENQEDRWYCLDTKGMATLCANEKDAKQTAKEADMDYPKNGPHKAVQLVEKGKNE